ncbi:hypothetical protein V8C42DRAFT_323359 [Trichoderma barbatum]
MLCLSQSLILILCLSVTHRGTLTKRLQTSKGRNFPCAYCAASLQIPAKPDYVASGGISIVQAAEREQAKRRGKASKRSREMGSAACPLFPRQVLTPCEAGEANRIMASWDLEALNSKPALIGYC